MKKYRDLVSAAIGFNPSRGDQLTVENISFEGVTEFIEQPTFFEKQAPVIMMSLRYLIVPVAFILLYLLFLRPVQKSVLANWSPAGAQLPGNTRALPRLPAPIQTPMTVKQLEAQLSGAPAQDSAGVGLASDYGPVAGPSRMEMMRKRVVEHAQADPETVARMVRVWLSDEKNK
jgi:flagellar biosynthesis/type III secretory pathway M-ring protein FliF/YscJ